MWCRAVSSQVPHPTLWSQLENLTRQFLTLAMFLKRHLKTRRGEKSNKCLHLTVRLRSYCATGAWTIWEMWRLWQAAPRNSRKRETENKMWRLWQSFATTKERKHKVWTTVKLCRFEKVYCLTSRKLKDKGFMESHKEAAGCGATSAKAPRSSFLSSNWTRWTQNSRELRFRVKAWLEHSGEKLG